MEVACLGLIQKDWVKVQKPQMSGKNSRTAETRDLSDYYTTYLTHQQEASEDYVTANFLLSTECTTPKLNHQHTSDIHSHQGHHDATLLRTTYARFVLADKRLPKEMSVNGQERTERRISNLLCPGCYATHR